MLDDALTPLEALPLPEAPAPRPAAEAPGPPAFGWRLERRGRGLRVDLHALVESPRGLRIGERLQPQRLPEPGSAPWKALGVQERKALTAWGAWRKDPTGLPLALLAALEGHPHLLWAEGPGEPGDPVALARRPSALTVQALDDGFRLALTVAPGPGPGRLERRGDHLAFTVFGPLHRALAEALGPGITVPPEAAPRLAAWLGRMAPQLPLWTDLRPEPAPEAAPLIRSLEVWLRGGLDRLDLTLRLRLDPALEACLPGEGFRWAVGGPPGQRRLFARDLAFEAARRDQVLALLPASARPLNEPLSWRIEGRPDVAAVLAGLRDLGSKVRVAGLPALRPTLPEPLGTGDLALDLKPEGHGFRLQGTLRGRPLAAWLPALRRGGRFLDLPDGGLLDLGGLLGTRLQGLATLTRGDLVPRAALALVGELSGSLVDARARARVEALEGPPAELPAAFRGTLRAYQLEGFRWMASRLGAGFGVCLADDMGLGKTVQTAALLLHRASSGPALVVAPTSVAPNWAAELARFAPDLAVRHFAEGARERLLEGAGPGTVILASYGRVAAEPALAALSWGTVVLDEAHAIKNPDTLRAQAVQRLRTEARLALTGTPVENHPSELVALLGWLLPDLAPALAEVPDAATLRALAAPFLLRRRKAEVLPELPPRTALTVRVELGEAEAAFHRDLLDRSRSALGSDTLHLLAALMRLRRACGHPVLADPAYRGPTAKLDLLMDRLAVLREEGHRSLVFSQFTDLLDLVQARLQAAGIPFRRLDGSLSAPARTREVAAFQAGEAEVFLLSLRAGGTGLNLTAADDVFHLDPWWNPAVEDQASDRAHRLGRTRPVTIHRLVAAGTIEERVLDLHAAKRALVADLLVEGAPPEGLDRAFLESLLAPS